MKDKILLFGGTTEGRELSNYLRSEDIPHAVSVATQYGEEILRENGEDSLLVGRKNAEDIEKLIAKDSYNIVVDATHPFATIASGEIKKACENAGVTYLRLSRNTGTNASGSANILYVDSLDKALEVLREENGNILLLTGSKELNKICESIDDISRIYARVLPNEDSISKCTAAGLSGKQIIAMQGPFSKTMNKALFEEVHASVILTKESGKIGGLDEKLEAAAECNIKAVVIKNPESKYEAGDCYDLEEIISEISRIIGIENPNLKAQYALTESNSLNKKTIVLAGVGPGDARYFTLELKDALENADIIFGAKTVISRLEKNDCPKVPVYRGEEIHEYLKAHPEFKCPVVAYSGDISLCSGASSSTEFFAEHGYDLHRIVGISSVTLFAKKLGLHLENVRIVSAHGRECNVLGTIRGEEELIILPSGVEHAAEICREILNEAFLWGDNNRNRYVIKIGYELGTENEKIIEIFDETDLNSLTGLEKGKCLLYIRDKKAADSSVIKGLSDDEIIRGKVPMTKEEIRALSMRKLALTKKAILYDIGAGTGSISLEAALTAPGIKVYSIEKKDEAVSLLKENKEKFALSNMEIIKGEAPLALTELPAPTHAFIGGSSGNMREILDAVFEKNENARIVINCVTLETFSEVIQILEELKVRVRDISADIIQVQVTRFKKAGNYHLSDALNPVYIITLQKERS
ncbi:precorrin-6A reductase [Butyrivibrio sp. WCD2001]|uniref:precorrin-6A reductase n=1 Tax=Butyrivibrio sp. WCD2001 TaxID=1280681 RepID=UPI00040EB57A|nr:precorrin-6A reductase [Butyrivibrio sp. WCD2001]